MCETEYIVLAVLTWNIHESAANMANRLTQNRCYYKGGRGADEAETRLSCSWCWELPGLTQALIVSRKQHIHAGRWMDHWTNRACLAPYQNLFSALSVIQVSFQIFQDGWGFLYSFKKERKLGDFCAFTSSFSKITLSLNCQHNSHCSAKNIFSYSVFLSCSPVQILKHSERQDTFTWGAKLK